jgi:hypothetical protein
MAEISFELSALFPNTPTHFPLLIEMDGIFRSLAFPTTGRRREASPAAPRPI